MTPQELKSVLQAGLLSFPLTDFDAALRFAPAAYAERLEWLQPYGASVLFAAGGTGEFFSLEPREFSDVVRVALDTCRGPHAHRRRRRRRHHAGDPVRAGGRAPRCPRHPPAAALPHRGQPGGSRGPHRDGVPQREDRRDRLQPRRLPPRAREPAGRSRSAVPTWSASRTAWAYIEKFVAVRQSLGDRFAYLGGLPTAEVFAGAYKAMGCPVYSSAVFNFAPRMAMAFYTAHAAGESATCERLIRDFFLPYIALRQSRRGLCGVDREGGGRRSSATPPARCDRPCPTCNPTSSSNCVP